MVINGSEGRSSVNHQPFVNPNAFSIPLLTPGTNGIPAGDDFKAGFGTTLRNVFRAPFQTVFNFSIFKNFGINERFNLKYQVDTFNLFHQPSLDTPDTDFELNPCFNPQPCYTTTPEVSKGYGVISGDGREQPLLSDVAAPDVLELRKYEFPSCLTRRGSFARLFSLTL